MGCFITLAIYFTFLTITIEIAKTARDRFGSFIAVGVCAFFFWQLTINLGGVLGLMPLTGVTLPFLSYGGSSTISVLSSVGFLMSVARKRFLF